MVRTLEGIDKELAYKIKDIIDDFHTDVVVVVDDDKMTFKDFSWDEFREAINTFKKNERIRNEEFLRRYRESHPEV